MLKKRLKRSLIIGISASILVNGLVFLWLASSSFSWGIPLPGIEVTLLLAVFMLFLMLVGVALTVLSRTRAKGLVLICTGLVFVLTFIVAQRAGHSVRMLGFQDFAARAAPLVAAIREYSQEYGRPPAELERLVPDFLPAIPSTGVGSAPNFRYITGDRALQNYHGNPWVLQLNVPTGMINWDILVYYPLQNYPTAGHGGVFEPVGDWAYVYE